MPCPFFDPVRPRGSAPDPRTAMLPLGDSWTGICIADPLHPTPADDSVLHPLCNLGYARHTCNRFPASSGPDAARFSIARDDSDAIRIAWVLERDHHPFGHGMLTWSRADRDFTAPDSAAPVRQARAYVASYLRRKQALLES
jgi:hypothetical protein